MAYNYRTGTGFAEARRLMSLTQHNLALAMHVHPGTIARIERSPSVPVKQQTKMRYLLQDFLDANPHIKEMLLPGRKAPAGPPLIVPRAETLAEILAPKQAAPESIPPTSELGMLLAASNPAPAAPVLSELDALLASSNPPLPFVQAVSPEEAAELDALLAKLPE